MIYDFIVMKTVSAFVYMLSETFTINSLFFLMVFNIWKVRPILNIFSFLQLEFCLINA